MSPRDFPPPPNVQGLSPNYVDLMRRVFIHHHMDGEGRNESGYLLFVPRHRLCQ